MIRTALFAAFMLAGAGAQAGIAIDSDGCDIDSDYGLTIESGRIAFTREDGPAARIEMAGGQMRIDGKPVALSEADRARVREFEAGVRKLVPEVRAIAMEAVEIAFTALQEVAVGLSGDPQPILDRMDASRARLVREVVGDESRLIIDEARVESAVDELVGEIVPELVGQITAAAVTAALAGDYDKIQEIESRADSLEAQVEAKVEPRAEALKARADALCPRVAELDALDEAFEVRLAGGERLDLLRVK